MAILQIVLLNPRGWFPQNPHRGVSIILFIFIFSFSPFPPFSFNFPHFPSFFSFFYDLSSKQSTKFNKKNNFQPKNCEKTRHFFLLLPEKRDSSLCTCIKNHKVSWHSANILISSSDYQVSLRLHGFRAEKKTNR